MAHASTDAQRAIPHCQAIEPGDGVDVDEVRRAGQAKGHHRREALSARQHPAFLRREFGEQPHGGLQCGGAVIGERRRLHRSPSQAGAASDDLLAPRRMVTQLYIPEVLPSSAAPLL